MTLQFISLPAILPSSCNVYTNSRKVFVKAIRKDIHTKIPASQNGLYVTAQHLGIASRNINTILQVGKTTCKVCPTIHILYLIKEEYRLPAIHAVIGLNDEIEVCSSHPLQTLVVEVYINNVLQKAFLLPIIAAHVDTTSRTFLPVLHPQTHSCHALPSQGDAPPMVCFLYILDSQILSF